MVFLVQSTSIQALVAVAVVELVQVRDLLVPLNLLHVVYVPLYEEHASFALIHPKPVVKHPVKNWSQVLSVVAVVL